MGVPDSATRRFRKQLIPCPLLTPELRPDNLAQPLIGLAGLVTVPMRHIHSPTRRLVSSALSWSLSRYCGSSRKIWGEAVLAILHEPADISRHVRMILV